MQFVQDKLGRDIAKYVVADYLMPSEETVKKNFTKVITQLNKISKRYNSFAEQNENDYRINIRDIDISFYHYACYFNNITKETKVTRKETITTYKNRQIKPNKVMLNIYDTYITDDEKIKKHQVIYDTIEEDDEMINGYVDEEEEDDEQYRRPRRRRRHGLIRPLKSLAALTGLGP